ncbi:glycosyltransferase involved in cell wall biosynthesis [Anseongella ginsenosidimutans]|uniref:Glycosyltransferase involved in cell wall biosynthesis n=1 Tax=Anseongella ginsenosidimutans TaxID=496056 RepID=A0A4R3KTW8_9SPHI|nr:glycosyltransferase family 4 protein [Anseongella ginsenosidimutans]QEC52865.1 glycosyltransferase family 4 protein [Anseongella ginsenosidimutans]TCS87255.1 glycosyltransferase involved in cell wall biosynthesis [Anseongella ginsenosidimutans]
MNYNGSNKPVRVLTWHVHGSYLYYLSQTPCEFFLPVKPGRPEGYGGRRGTFPWGENVHEVAAGDVRNMEFDCILFQSRKNYLEDQYELLDASQLDLPKIYLEHDPPRESPTDTHHFINDPDALLVHVTHFNKLMWNNNRTPATVIEHGVMIPPGVHYTGELEKGIVVINEISRRGRRLGLDIFEELRQKIPLDLVGMGSEEAGGLGEIPGPELPAFLARYRFFFNPIRYTSLGLAVCEAMQTGLPVVGLATTEMAVTIENEVSGYIHTDIEYLAEKMRLLLNDRERAAAMGAEARKLAMKKFGIERFAGDWMSLLQKKIYHEKENSVHQ